MAKRVSRLQFTEEELNAPDLQKSVPDAHGEGASRLSHAVKVSPLNAASAISHSKLSENSEGSASASVSHEVIEGAAGSVRTVDSTRRKLQSTSYARALRAERAADRANLKILYKEAKDQNPKWGASPISRFQQKRAIKKAYAEAKAGRSAVSAGKTANNAGKVVKRSEKASSRIAQFTTRHRRGFLIIGVMMLIVLMCSSLLSSCSLMMGSVPPSNVVSTYPSEDADMLAAEARYKALENELQSYLDNYESTHDYDEYHYELDEIEHDPYVLISMLTAAREGAWTIDEVGGLLQTYFDRQYILTETLAFETRYRTETRTGSYPVTDPETGETSIISYEYDVQVPYTYTICTVKLENFNLSHLPVYLMDENHLSLYAMYMSTLGNRPDLFSNSAYVGKYYGEQYRYEIPAEALADEQFAAMVAEAEKYLGFPYVWGGSSPRTSFECSGFVSWVLNHCGVGWNVGRKRAEELRGICSYVSPANAKPGDLIFFEKTYDTSGASHVGIYVGNNMMIHCGDPIRYASIDTNYWRKHFLQFGRLPNP